jgi:uncharacterized protein
VIASRSLVVSIHDVAPSTRSRVERILSELAEEGVTRCSLLVVPNYHHTGRSLGAPDFVEWMKGLRRQGHEIVLHGYYHQRRRRAGESLVDRLITRNYTADEGEFFDLAYEEALPLLKAAADEFAAHDLHPSGFIAPAWLLAAAAERALRDLGFRYTTTLRTVRDLVSGMEISSQSMVYSVRSKWRSSLSLVWNRTLFHCLTKNRLLRLGLHPPDLQHPRIWRQIRAIVRQALADRRALTYEEWINLQSVPRKQPVSVP